MDIKNQDITTFPAPPSVFKTLIKGFNIVANHIYLIILPILLDLFLWLGPQVKVDSLIDPFFALIKESAQQLPAEIITALTEIKVSMNLLSVLRTYPVGIFSLFSTALSNDTPLGAKAPMLFLTIESNLIVILALNLIGILFGILYFRSVSRVSLSANNALSLPKLILNVFLLDIIWFVFFFFLNLPLSVLFLLISQLGDGVRSFLGILLMVPLAWLLMLVFYSYFPLFDGTTNVLEGFKLSWRSLRYGIPTLGWFTIIALFISQAMDALWRSAPSTSWMSLFGIFGHGFVATGLLAASFMYYQETNSWIEQTVLWFKSKNEIKNSGR